MKIIAPNKDTNIWFTSDTHYGHHNICRATSNWGNYIDKQGNKCIDEPILDALTRDFESLDQMNDTIVNNINSVVKRNDILIHLGDWSFGGFDNIVEFRRKINCKNVHLTFGNHDHHIRRNKNYQKKSYQDIFSSTQDYLHLDLRRPSRTEKGIVDKWTFVCMHYPIASWDSMNKGTIHLHGHCHLPEHLKIADGRAMDVGVDGNNLEPYNLEEILALMDERPIKKLALPSEHHEQRTRVEEIKK